MPLNISIDPNNTGSPATYWVVTGVNIDFIGQIANISFNGYTSSTAYGNGDAPLVSTTLQIAYAGNATTAALIAGAKSNLYSDCLNYPTFSGASIVS